MPLHDQIAFPRTDLCVSPVALGTAGLGVDQFESDAHALLDRFVDLGGNFLDTARVYSDWVPGESGRSERIIGDWLVRRKGIRDKLVISTKGLHAPWTDRDQRRVSFEQARHDIEASLVALGLDRIDIYHLHADDPTIPVNEIVDFMQTFRNEGKVRYLAVSNWSTDRLDAANKYAAESGKAGFVARHLTYSPASWMDTAAPDRECSVMTKRSFQFHRREKLAVLAGSPLAGGFFHRFETGRSRPPPAETATRNPNLSHTVTRFSSARRCPVTSVLLGYLLHQPFPVFPVVGCRRLEDVEEVARALDLHLNRQELQRIEDAAGSGIWHK